MVSVIIPTYNRCELLKRSVDSVLNQTYSDFELIIVDDGSTDGTEELIKSYGDDRIRYIRNERNCGAHVSRNNGIKAAKGQFIAFQDSDDEWLPQKLQMQMDILADSDDTVGMVFCRFHQYFSNGVKSVCPDLNEVPDNYSGYILEVLLRTPLAGTPTMLIKKSVLDDVGLFDENIACLEDYELSLRIARKYQLIMIDEPLMISYVSMDGVNADIPEALRVRCGLLKEFREEYLSAKLFEIVVASLIRDALRLGIQGEISQLIAEALS